MRETVVATKIKELVLSYKDSKKWPELDALFQLSTVLIEDSYIVSNIETRYKLDGKSCLAKVKDDFRARGVEDTNKMCDTIGYFFSTRCGTYFESMVESRVRSLEPKFKKVANELSLYKEGLLLAPKWTLKACSWSIDALEEETEGKLVETGIVNRYYYNSNAFSHPAWNVPDYVQLILNHVKQFPENYGAIKFDIARIRGLAQDSEIRSFVEWVLERGSETGLNLYVPEDEFEKRLEEKGERLKRVTAKLTGYGAMTLSYSPERRRVGRMSSRPADCVFNISLELIEAIGETK